MGILKNLVNSLYKVEIHGIEKIDLNKPSIIMPNHTSLLDAPLLALNLPEHITFVADTQIAKKFAFINKYRKVITVDPTNPYSIRTMIREIESGKTLMIFPEGRITTTGGLMRVFPGVGYIAMKTGVPLYPIGIDGADRSKLSYLGNKNKTVMFPKVKITVGEPFYIHKREGVSMKIQKEDASNQILKSLQKQVTATRIKNNTNLFNILLDSSKIYGKDTKICEDVSGITTYKKLILNTYVLSNALKKMVGNEKNVGVLLPNVTAHVATLFSLFRIGKTPSILNFSSGVQSIVDCCETAELKTVITSKKFIEDGKFESIIEGLKNNYSIVYLEDVKDKITITDKFSGIFANLFSVKSKSLENELILFTSGSESKPKGVVLKHDNIFSNIQQARGIMDVTQKDIILNALPMFHSFGLTAGTILPIVCGAKVVLYPSPLHYKQIPQVSYFKNATMLFGTSTFLQGYGRNAHHTSFYSIRHVFAGAEKLKDEVRDMWLKKFGIRIFEGYGATEASPVVSINTPMLHKEGSVGQFLPLVDYKIEPISGIENGGNLHIKGPNLLKGYMIHNKGFVPAEEWYNTGDVVDVDEEGYVFIKSRLKRFAKIGGEMISLNLVEEVAGNCFQDTNVASINIPDQRKGEKIVLFVTNSQYKLETLREYISQKGFSPLLAPTKIIVVQKIPLLGSGKNDYVTMKTIVE